MEAYINIIADKILNYKGFNFPVINHLGITTKEKVIDHVTKWLNQFDENERALVIRVTADLLQRYFITEQIESNFLENFFGMQSFLIKDTVPLFLNIQKQGNSQKILYEKFERMRLNRELKTRKNSYIYVDDFIFSGGRVTQDLIPWLESLEENSELIIGLIGWYKTGQYQVSKRISSKIEEIKKDKKITITFNFIYMADHWILENTKFYRNFSENLWPTENLMNNKDLIENKLEGVTYRTFFGNQRVFQNERERNFFEYICLKYGFKIRAKALSPNMKTRALGNHFFDYGFGGLVFNYRNCPNNTPLIFWWGSTNPNDAMSTHWYPLMQRRIY